MTATERPVTRDGDMALVDIAIPSTDRCHLHTLLAGVHALSIEEAAVAPVPLVAA